MTRSTKTALLSFILTLAVAASSQAEPSAPSRRARATRTTPKVQLQERLQQLPGATHFTRGGKLHVAITSGGAADKALQRQPHTIEFFARKGYMHLFTRVKGVVFDRHTTVNATRLKDSHNKDREHSGVLLELPVPLYKQLIKHIAKAKKDPTGTVGSFLMDGGKFPAQSNCTSWVSLARMGDQKLVEALGIPRGTPGISDANLTRHPQSWINALIDHSPYAKAVIMRNHEKTSAEEAKIDFSVGSRRLVR